MLQFSAFPWNLLSLCYDFVLHFCPEYTLGFPCVYFQNNFLASGLILFLILTNKVASSTQTRSWCVLFSSKPFWISWIFLMAKLKVSNDKTFHCIREFWTEMHYIIAYLRGFYRFQLHTFLISLNSFRCIPNPMRILHLYFLLDWVIGFHDTGN